MKRSTFIVYILPSTIILICTVLYPLCYTVWTSLYDIRLTGAEPIYVGFLNYTQVLQSRQFWISVKNTTYFAIFALFFQFLIGFVIALFVNEIVICKKVFSVLLYTPLVIAPTAVGLFMKWMFNANYGLINYFLSIVGISPVAWLSNPQTAIWALIISDVWQWTPFVILVLIAAMQSIQNEQIEAAHLDGANFLQVIGYIILPALKPIILFILVIRSTNAVRMYDKVYVMTGGGPGRATETLLYYNYRVAFGELSIGKASSISVLSLLILMILALFLIFFLFQKESDV